MAAPEDAEAIRTIYAPIVEQTAISFETTPPDAAEMARRISSLTGSFPWLLLEQPGDILGYAYGGNFRRREAYRLSCEVTIYLAEKARGSGNGRRLYKSTHEVATSFDWQEF